jgi:lupus La protein
MSDPKVDETAPDPTVTATSDNEATKVDETTAAAVESGDVKADETNGEEVKKENEAEVKKSGTRSDGNASKYDPSVLPDTDDPVQIRGQVNRVNFLGRLSNNWHYWQIEFYFSDSNLLIDDFMMRQIGGASNLPVKVETLLKFGRVKRFKPVSAIVPALRESAFLEVTGPEGQEEVKRKVPYDPVTGPSKLDSRSVYVKGFGDEEASTQFDIEAFFQPHGPIRSVRLRRANDSKLFKGSVFVEFENEETQEKFLALDPKPLWKGEQLIVTSKKEYTDKKTQDIRDGKLVPSETWSRGANRGKFRGRGNRGGRGRGDRDRGDRDPDDWKKRREDDRANGFKDDKNRRGGRDNRGRGRRDNNNNNRGGRNNDRNRDRNGYSLPTSQTFSHANISTVTTKKKRSPSPRTQMPNLKCRLKTIRSELVRTTVEKRKPQRK